MSTLRKEGIMFLRKRAAVVIGALAWGAVVHAASGPTSAYTDLSKCKITDSSEQHLGEADANPDFFESTCSNFSGYRILHNGSDARSWLVIKRGGLNWDTRNGLSDTVPGHFPQIAGKMIEWRLAPGAKEPYALILRIAAQDEQAQKDVEWLAILRVRPKAIGVAGVIKATGNPNANQAARDLADREAQQ